MFTAIFEKVVPTAVKNMRGCSCNTIWGDANAHQVEETNRIVGDINGRSAS